MFIGWDTTYDFAVRRGGKSLDEYQARLVPPLRTALEVELSVQCYRHHTPMEWTRGL